MADGKLRSVDPRALEGGAVTLAEQVARLQAERDELGALVARLYAHQAEVGRKLYRRGYLAGRAAQRRGAPSTSAPERHARGETRELLG